MKLLSILILALSGSMASAASDAPQFLWQAGGGDHVVEAGYNYSNISTQASGGANESTLSRNRMSASYEYGLNDMMSFGIGLDYLTGQAEVGTSKVNLDGIEHIALDFRGNYGLGFGKLYYGLSAKLAIEDFEEETNGDFNASPGHHSFTPFVALAMKTGGNAYGVRLAYKYNTKTKNENGLDLEGGNGMFASLYYERDLSDKSILGVALNYTQFDDFEDDNGNDVRGSFDQNNIRADIYGAIGCGCGTGGWTFLPKVSYFMVDDENFDKTADIESSGGSYAVEFALRKSF